MAKWIEVAKESELDKRLSVKVKRKPIVLFRLDDGIYAIDAVCSHEYSLLSEGEVWDCTVYCPKHGSGFDIKTGKNLHYPATQPVKTYEVKVEDEKIFVKMGWGS